MVEERTVAHDAGAVRGSFIGQPHFFIGERCAHCGVNFYEILDGIDYALPCESEREPIVWSTSTDHPDQITNAPELLEEAGQ